MADCLSRFHFQSHTGHHSFRNLLIEYRNLLFVDNMAGSIEAALAHRTVKIITNNYNISAVCVQLRMNSCHSIRLTTFDNILRLNIFLRLFERLHSYCCGAKKQTKTQLKNETTNTPVSLALAIASQLIYHYAHNGYDRKPLPHSASLSYLRFKRK